MVFHSYAFILVFLPIVLAGYLVLSKKLSKSQPAQLWLVAASLVFYGLWDIRYLPLLLGSALANFGIIWALTRLLADDWRRRPLLVLGIVANLAVLGYFKYANFFLENINALGTDVGYLQLALPVGISFYTFIQIGCLVDAYNGQVEGLGFSKYLLFATFFPYVTAGPLVQQREMFRQMDSSPGRRIGATQISVGLTLFAIGLFKKVILADGIAPYADTLFETAGTGGGLTAATAWLGALAYTLQLYFDFSGYTDMALALGYMVGLRLPLNFNSPLKSTSIIDFWRRWHITMTRFFTNYVYTPLATTSMRRAVARDHSPSRRLLGVVLIPVVITFTVAGLWHGPGWTFVIFGLIHGLALAANHTWRQLRSSFPALPRIPAVPAWALTMLVFVVSLVFFRAGNLTTATRVVGAMAGLSGDGAATIGEFYSTATVLDITVAPIAIWLVVLGGIAVLAPKNSQEILADYDVALQSLERESVPDRVRGLWRPTPAWAVPVALLIVAAFAMMGQGSPFVYYQF